MIQLQLEDLKKLLEDAYSEGWSGSLEIKESYVNDVLKKYKSETKEAFNKALEDYCNTSFNYTMISTTF